MSLLSALRSHRARRIVLVTGASGFPGRHLLTVPASADQEVGDR